MDALKHIIEKFNIDLEQKSPIKLPFDRFRGLTGLFRELEFKVGAEIGVDKGRYSKWICQKVPNIKLYCIDPWNAYDEYVEQHGEAGQVVLDDCYKAAKERLAPYNVKFIKKTSMKALKDFEDESLDFVFIDGNHTYEYVAEDIAQWEKKVRKGGIVSGHDFWRSSEMKKPYILGLDPVRRMKLCQVKDVVESWTYANQIKYFITSGDGCPSWFYVK